MGHWDTFNENTKDNPPRELYQEAIKLVPPSSTCLDVGAGALVDTKDMLARGHHVVAIDSNPSLLRLAQQVGSPLLDPTITTMEGYDYGYERFDYINAMFSLPFIEAAAFNQTFKNIVTSLKPDGILAFHLFGDDDYRYGNQKMSFHTIDQARQLIDGLEVIVLREIKHKGKEVSGKENRSDVLQVIVKKNSHQDSMVK